MYAELGKLSFNLKHAWLQQSLKNQARLQKMDERRLRIIAFLVDMQLGLRWLSGLKDELREHGIGVRMPGRPGCMAEYDVTSCSRALKDSFI